MSDSERQGVVNSIFGDGTGEHYDRIVDFSTAGLDKVWKAELLARVKEPKRVLDLACGTAILTFRLKEQFPDVQIVGVDMTADYLAVAREKVAQAGLEGVDFLHSAAEDAPLEGVFDTIVTSYLPKYADLSRLIPLLRAHSEPGTRLIMHDFTYPHDPVVARFLTWRFIRLRDWARAELPEAVSMFENLPQVVQDSDWVEELQSELGRNGFGEITLDYLDQKQAAIVTAVAV